MFYITSNAQSKEEHDLFEKGESLIDYNEYSKAVGVFDKLINLNNKRAKFFEEKAYCLFIMGNYSGALGTLSKGIECMPDSTNLYQKKAIVYENLNASKEAIKIYSQALDIEKDSLIKSDIYTYRGASKTKMRDFEAAYKDHLKALELYPENILALNNIAAVCDEVNKPEDTLKYLRQVIEIDPNFAPAYVNIGYKFQQMEQFDKSIEFFDKAITLDPKGALGYSNRSFSKLKTEDYQGAMQDIIYSLELMPSNSYAYKIKALIHIAQKDNNLACKALHVAENYDYTMIYGDEVETLIKQYCHRQ